MEKNETDMALAFREGYERGHRRFALVGAAGGRPDHTFANMQLLVKAASMGAFAQLYDGDYRVTALVKNGELRLKGTGTVSVFAAGEASGVTLRGMKYALEGVTLRGDMPLGVSNSLEGGEALITMESGALLVFWEARGIECAPLI